MKVEDFKIKVYDKISDLEKNKHNLIGGAYVDVNEKTIHILEKTLLFNLILAHEKSHIIELGSKRYFFARFFYRYGPLFFAFWLGSFFLSKFFEWSVFDFLFIASTLSYWLLKWIEHREERIVDKLAIKLLRRKQP